MADFDRESMLEMFIFEMNQLIEQLEQIIVQSETEYNAEQINEIFRVMHTIKGSAAMMLYDNIASVAHAVEDLFYYLREESPQNIDYHTLSDHVLEGADFVKAELVKIQNGEVVDGDGTELVTLIKQFLKDLKQTDQTGTSSEKITPATAETPTTGTASAAAFVEVTGVGNMHHYKAKVSFEDGCEMENIRAYTLVHNLGDMAHDITHIPEDVIDDEATEIIRKNGFHLQFVSERAYKDIFDHLNQTVYLRELTLTETTEEQPIETVAAAAETTEVEIHAENPVEHIPSEDAHHADAKYSSSMGMGEETGSAKKATGTPTQSMISINVSKLDALVNLMGELVISEAMVTQNSELDGLQLDSFVKETRQLKQIINNLRSTIMSMRLVPLSGTFFKMHRIVRDMCRQLEKDVQLDIVGEETEVDKSVIEHISDPIMHIIRNSIDHGIEMPAERKAAGKPAKGRVLLEAKNAGGDVLIVIKDDGAGLDRHKILKRARENGLLNRPDSEYTDKEVHQFIFLPGFSTNDQVTAFSGRGVGMDVVTANLEAVHGTALVDSVPGEGSTFTLKIPTTLSIVEGMSVLLAGAKYTIPITSIIMSFKVDNKESVFADPNGNEMVTVRGEILNVVRLYEFFGIEGAVTNIEDGILVMIESGEQTICLLVDDLIGQQQVVVKSMPKYFKKVRGLSGCTLLGNGDISLIIDVAGFFDR